MENLKNSFIDTFDHTFTTNHIQVLKLMIPQFDIQMQKKMSVYIKYLELQHALKLVRQKPYQMCGLFCEEKSDMKTTCKSIIPLCSENEQKKIKEMLNLLNTLDMMNEMSGMMDMFSAGSPFQDFSEADSGNGFDVVSMLTSMLSPEQQDIMKQMEAMNV